LIGDGGYDTREVYETLKALGIDSVIPPQKNGKIKLHGNCSAEQLIRDQHLREIRKVGKKEWKKNSGYHQRSKVETAMFRYNATFGGNLKARKFENQETEALIGFKILNTFFQV